MMIIYIPNKVVHDADLAAHVVQPNTVELDPDSADQDKKLCDSSDCDNTPRKNNHDEIDSRLL